MIEEILNELEGYIGTDEFEFIMVDKMEELEKSGAGIEAVEPILKMMERHPLDDFGIPGDMVNFVEKFSGYEELLVESLKRRPALHTVWMLNCLINLDKKYIDLMEEIAGREEIEKEIRESAEEFLEFQKNRKQKKVIRKE